MAITDVLVEAESLFSSMSLYLNKIVIALVIVLAGFIIGKIIESILRHVFARMNIDDHLAKTFNARRNYARAIRRTIVRLIYIISIVLALREVSLVGPVFIMLEFLAVVIVLISFVLAGIEVLPNIAARGTLHSRKIVVGDDISFSDSTGTIQGTIMDMTLTEVRVKRRNGDIFFIPNAVFLKQSITKKRKA